MNAPKIARANLLLIGCGPHAERTYLPAIKALAAEMPVKLCGIVELEGEATVERVKRMIGAHYRDIRDIDIITTPVFTHELQLPFYLARQLDKAVEQHSINGVIIATEPRAHMQYALWAAAKGLHVLMDKPISTYENVISSVDQAMKLERDQALLSEACQADRAVLINAERRYRPDFRYVFEAVDKLARDYGIPVTSMQSLHADGQWRLPHEILTESYHGYNAGYGEISHGGYHTADIVSQVVLRSFASAQKSFDQVGVYTKTLKPRGLLLQQTKADYRKTFGDDYLQANPYSDEQLAQRFATFGEVDAASLVTLYSQKEVICQLTMNLIHNSFSRRGSLFTNQDLYNGNGRVRHEQYNIEQGPYQNIQIHAYHADQERLTNGPGDEELGGNEHFDIYIFRNSKLLGGKPLEVIRSRDLALAGGYDPSKVLIEQAKGEVVREFIEIILGRRRARDSYSHISSHALTAKFMSLMYRSTIKGSEVRSPVVAPVRRTLERIPAHEVLRPRICIVGAACTGKTTLIDALKRLDPEMVTFGHTPAYVYEWLRSSNIGDVGAVQLSQAERREQIFMRVNEQEAKVIDDILSEHPVASVRGRADTLITHAAIRGKRMPRSIDTLLPQTMRPDVLVVLTASSEALDARLQERHQPKTGMNSLAFHDRCQEMYTDLAGIAAKHMPTFVFDTSAAAKTPDELAAIVRAAYL